MLPFKEIRSAIVRNLAAYLHLPIIEMNGGGDIPEGPFLTYDFPGGFGEELGFASVYLEDHTRIERETVNFTVSFLSYADDRAVSIENGLAARDWFKGEGRLLLRDAVNVVVVSVGPLENRDITIGPEWERRQGYEVELRTIAEVETPRDLIEGIELKEDE